MVVAPFAERQLPLDGEVFLDHVGLFARDEDAAARSLAALGFTVTPFTTQTNPDPDGGPPKLTGTGNRCVMLARGYLEVLVKTADTPLSREFDAALARHPGQHLTAFATQDATAARARLQRHGFAVRPLVALRRKVEVEGGTAEVAFTVTRVAPGAMDEGRIQFLTHHTEAAVWQPRWLRHRNTARALTDQAIIVATPDEAVGRWERFLARPAEPIANGYLFALERGRLALLSPDALGNVSPGVEAPSLPFMAALAVEVADLQACADAVGAPADAVAAGRLTVQLPDALGTGALHFLAPGAHPQWL